MSDIVKRAKAIEALNVGCVRELVAEIERLRDTLRITDPDNLLKRLQAAEADLAEAEALLSEIMENDWQICPKARAWLARRKAD